jgi:hypothetical protein
VNKPTFYEQLGIVIPGSFFLFGLVLLFPTWCGLLVEDGVSIGQLGIFILLSYAAGQLVAAAGNVGESLLWRLAGGMPSDWVIKSKTKLISPQQRELLEEEVRSRLHVNIETVCGLERKCGGQFLASFMRTLRDTANRIALTHSMVTMDSIGALRRLASCSLALRLLRRIG